MKARLTKEAEKLLAQIYKRYLEKRKSGEARDIARQFGSSAELKSDLRLKALLVDVDSLCWELSRFGLVDVQPGDVTIYDLQLTNSGIAQLDRKFTDGLGAVVDFIAKFK